MHRFAVHDGICRKADVSLRWHDDDAFAAVEILKIAEISDVGVIRAIADNNENVDLFLRHETAQPVNPLIILRRGKRKIHPRQTVLKRIRNSSPAIRHLWTIARTHKLLSVAWRQNLPQVESGFLLAHRLKPKF